MLEELRAEYLALQDRSNVLTIRGKRLAGKTGTAPSPANLAELNAINVELARLLARMTEIRKAIDEA